MDEIESSITRYLTALDTADRQEPTSSETRTVRLEEKIAWLKVQIKALQAIEIRLNDSPDNQVSLTGPDARSLHREREFMALPKVTGSPVKWSRGIDV
jgi:hypothetical protein